jgi:glycerol-3-phosphate dehydrogenase (NAD(P)+)
MAERITIIGDGAMATVCALLLENQGHAVTLWGPFSDHVAELIQTRENKRYLPGYHLPDRIRFTADSQKALAEATIAVSAIPSPFIREVWSGLAAGLPAETGIVSVAKGIEQQTMQGPTQIIADVLNQSDAAEAHSHPLAAISGPSVAHELARCLPATVCAASADPAFAERVQQVFTTNWFRVYTNDDLLGVELAGATKNVIALAAGILDGLQAGINAKSALLSRGLAEISRLGVAMGASQQTFFGVAGVGDLATTCFSPTGRNRTCGEELGRGRKLDAVLQDFPGIVEGVPTTRAVHSLAQEHGVDMPITHGIHEVLFEGLDPLEAIQQLMTRQPKAERVR